MIVVSIPEEKDKARTVLEQLSHFTPDSRKAMVPAFKELSGRESI